MNKYKCDSHSLSLACLDCVKSTYAKYYSLLEFVKQISHPEICCCVSSSEYCHSFKSQNILDEIGEIK